VRATLAVAPDGRAVAAYEGVDSVRAYERAPGAARFTTALPPQQGGAPVVAVRDGGGALIAWRSDGRDPTAGFVATVRTAAGPFGQPQEIAPDVSTFSAFDGLFYAFSGSGPFPPPDDGNAALKVALAPDGRALLAWGGGEQSRAAVTPRIAAGTLDAGFGTPQRLGGPVRDANGVAPLFLADGRAALAWTDNSGGMSSGDGLGTPRPATRPPSRRSAVAAGRVSA
jgi:hypothetical protein